MPPIDGTQASIERTDDSWRMRRYGFYTCDYRQSGEGVTMKDEGNALPLIEITPIDPKYGMAIIDGKMRVVKNATGEPIPEDEPLCLFRARDNLSLVGALIPYRAESRADGCTDYHLKGIQNRIDEFYQFQREHP